MRHCGIDVHSRTSELCEVSEQGEVLRRERLSTTQAGFRRRFEGAAKARVMLESGGSTPWIRRLLESLGHEVVVVTKGRVRLIAESTSKCDRIDAEVLARMSRMDPKLLPSVYQRSFEGQMLRTRLRLRSSLVQAKAALINQVRGTLRAHGVPMGSCATLKRWGEALVNRLGKKRAVVALARKIAVLLHTLWTTGERYRPFPAVG